MIFKCEDKESNAFHALNNYSGIATFVGHNI